MNIEMKVEKNYLVVIKPGESDWEFEELKTIPDLDKLKKGLNGGLLEIVPSFNKFMNRACVAFCDEEGKMKGLQHNQAAQMLWSQSYGKRIFEDHLVGPIVIIVGSPSFLARL